MKFTLGNKTSHKRTAIWKKIDLNAITNVHKCHHTRESEWCLWCSTWGSSWCSPDLKLQPSQFCRWVLFKRASNIKLAKTWLDLRKRSSIRLTPWLQLTHTNALMHNLNNSTTKALPIAKLGFLKTSTIESNFLKNFLNEIILQHQKLLWEFSYVFIFPCDVISFLFWFFNYTKELIF